MDLEFSADQQELRASVRSVLARECPPSVPRVITETNDDAGAVRLWTRMIELDWPALTVPADCGGIGGNFLDLAVVAEEMGRVMAPGPFIPTVGQFVPVVRELGTDEQRKRFLGGVAAGELTATLALAEQSWSLDNVTLCARSTGEGWLLEGMKTHVLEGGRSKEVAVVARDVDGTLGVWVAPGAAVRVEPIDALDGSRQLATMHFDGVAVGPDRRLGQPGIDAGAGLERALHEATTTLALEAVGTCQAIFDLALQYSKDRHQFGVPIGSFQAVKHRFADLLIALERARATCYFAAATIAEEDARRPLAVAMAKAAVSDCQRFVTQEGIQLLGGIGFTWEHDMHLYVKRARTFDALFGSGHEHRKTVADLIGL